MDNSLLPNWSFGTQSIPGYLEPVISDLVELRHHQAQELLLTGSRALSLRVQHHRRVGQAQTTAYRDLYGTDSQSLKKAEGKMKELVTRDNKDCMDTLNHRTEEIRANPIDDNQIIETLIHRPATSLRRSEPSRTRSRSPGGA